MDARLRDLVESVLVARSVPAGMRPEFVARMRATDDWRTIAEQFVCQASDRALLALIDVLVARLLAATN
mgnify:CR=1 FL=1